MTFKARLNRNANKFGKINVMDPALAEAIRLHQIKAKARTHIANNPAPRALYLLG